MALLEQWRKTAYSETADKQALQNLWTAYFQEEKNIYAELLKDPDTVVKGTVKELAEKFGLSISYMVGFLDGIEESLLSANGIEEITEDSEVSLAFDPEKLYMNMVGCNAEWLYTLPQWDAIFTEEKRKELYKTEKSSRTVVKPHKIGRNDPCPCGSGKKYKKCCGAN